MNMISLLAVTCMTEFHLILLYTDEPEVTIEGFDDNWYLNREDVQLICLANANPAISSFQWR